MNPNGFPSGEHYTLNIHGKKLSFSCPAPELDQNGDETFGNSVFVPEDGVGIQLLMESGSGKGKHAETFTDFGVTDPCTADFDGDAARLRIPANDKGYRVYARALAKPTDDPSLQVTPELVYVEDEFGNDLVYLGLVTDNGFETPFESFTRTKGKSRAVDISGLFQWSGEVCYLSSSLCDPIDECTTTSLCCTDLEGDGVFESCSPKADVEIDGLCPEGSVETTAYCKSFEAAWVFSIADLVRYLWEIENNGLKLLQVRFYPN